MRKVYETDDGQHFTDYEAAETHERQEGLLELLRTWAKDLSDGQQDSTVHILQLKDKIIKDFDAMMRIVLGFDSRDLEEND